MLRAALVIAAAACLTLLAIAAGTSVILRTTDFGKVVTGNVHGVADPWKVFMGGQNLLFFYVDLPTVLVIAFFAAVLAKRFAIAAAVLSTAPCWLLLVAVPDLLRGGVLLLCAVCAGILSTWWRKSRGRRPGHEMAIAAKHSN